MTTLWPRPCPASTQDRVPHPTPGHLQQDHLPIINPRGAFCVAPAHGNAAPVSRCNHPSAAFAGPRKRAPVLYPSTSSFRLNLPYLLGSMAHPATGGALVELSVPGLAPYHTHMHRIPPRQVSQGCELQWDTKPDAAHCKRPKALQLLSPLICPVPRAGRTPKQGCNPPPRCAAAATQCPKQGLYTGQRLTATVCSRGSCRHGGAALDPKQEP